MFTRDDLIDSIVRHLQPLQKAAPFAAPAPPAPSRWLPPPGPNGKLFLTESDIKKRVLTAGGMRLTLPADAIISPLASDWLILKGITVVRE